MTVDPSLGHASWQSTLSRTGIKTVDTTPGKATRQSTLSRTSYTTVDTGNMTSDTVSLTCYMVVDITLEQSA